MNPPSFEMKIVPQTQNHWNGDCWRAWLSLRQERDDLEMFAVDTDYDVA